MIDQQENGRCGNETGGEIKAQTPGLADGKVRGCALCAGEGHYGGGQRDKEGSTMRQKKAIMMRAAGQTQATGSVTPRSLLTKLAAVVIICSNKQFLASSHVQVIRR